MIYISFDIGIKNLAYCIIKEENNEIYIIDWKIIELVQFKKEIKGIENITNRLYIELDNIIGIINDLGYKNINYVLIENQPSNLNGIMKTIQLLIFSYFNLLKHWDNLIDNVLLINASLKLQNHSHIPLSKIDKTIKYNRREKYLNNKKDGIELCKYYINDNNKLLDYYNFHKKKDDLADCLLQVISYIRKNNKNIEKILLHNNNLL